MGKEVLAMSNVLYSLTRRFNCVTTDIIAKGTTLTDEVYVQSLSSEEVGRLVDFFNSFPCLKAIGMNESSALFICLKMNYMYATTNAISKRLCSLLGVNCIDIAINNESEGTVVESQNSTKSMWAEFVKVACL